MVGSQLDVLLSCLTLFEKCMQSLNDMSLVFVPAMTAHPGYVLRQRVLEGREFFEKVSFSPIDSISAGCF